MVAPLGSFTLGSFSVVTRGANGQTVVPANQVNLQTLADELVLAVAKINELVTANTTLTATVATLQSDLDALDARVVTLEEA